MYQITPNIINIHVPKEILEKIISYMDVFWVILAFIAIIKATINNIKPEIATILVPIPNMPIAPQIKNKTIQLATVNKGATFRKFENCEKKNTNPNREKKLIKTKEKVSLSLADMRGQMNKH